MYESPPPLSSGKPRRLRFATLFSLYLVLSAQFARSSWVNVNFMVNKMRGETLRQRSQCAQMARKRSFS
ncbi:hypothetical protein KPLM21_40029 [Klebsiella pneumoniae]|nr:hypothetical protein KP13_31757 [Klebsiella pneumoniae subsp. pneumoniae Kp13]CED74704.1 hypothetical protein KPLM21_40029 [Klebsiella pneumoniae]